MRNFIKLASFLLLYVFIVAECQSNDGAIVVVKIEGITPDIQEINVSAILNGMPYKEPKSYPNTVSSFKTILDPGITGNITFNINGLLDQCTLAAGTNQANLNGESRVDITVTLVRLINRLCTLTIKKLGSGFVTSQPIGINCGQQCSAYFDYRMTVSLFAKPDIPGIPYQWTGSGTEACKGSNECVVTITGPISIGINFTPRVCSVDNWCWDNPWPQGNNLYGVWVASDNTVFAVGNNGTILRSKDAGWIILKTDTTNILTDIWGLNSNEIWAVGENGTIVRCLNGTCSIIPSGTTSELLSVWGFSSSNIWTVGPKGVVLHWDGTQWVSMSKGIDTTKYLQRIWGIQPNDLWILGIGEVFRGNGTLSWIKDETGLSGQSSLWGTSSDNIVVTSNTDKVARWNGAFWRVETVPNGQVSSLRRAWGNGPNSIWVTGDNYIARWDGYNWMQEMTSEYHIWYSLFGTGSDNIWLVGDNGVIAHRDSTQWKLISNSLLGELQSWSQGWSGGDEKSTWLVGINGKIASWDGLTWKLVSSPTTNNLEAIWGSAPDDVWAVGYKGTIIRWNGIVWKTVNSGTQEALVGVTGKSANSVWALSSKGSVFLWDGIIWSKMNPLLITSPSEAYDILYDGMNLWVATDDGIFRWNSTIWQKTSTSPAHRLSGNVTSGVHTINPYDHFQWNGVAWNEISVSNVGLNSVNVIAQNDIWIVGDSGLGLHWDGIAWKRVDMGTSVSLEGFFGTATDRFVIGSGGTILHHH